jgi:hypothetical protein
MYQGTGTFSEGARMAIRRGIIGCGKVTEVKSRPKFQQASDSELVMVMRRNPARAEDQPGAMEFRDGPLVPKQ